MKKFSFLYMTLLLAAAFTIGCSSGGGGDDPDPTDPNNPVIPALPGPPTISYTNPADHEAGVPLNRLVTATFNEGMDSDTINTTTFKLTQGTTVVPGTVTYSGTTATFDPDGFFAPSTAYTATISIGAEDQEGIALEADKVWSFTTGTVIAAGPSPVILGTAGNFAVLSKSGIATVPTSAIVGDIGVSPAAASYLTGFSLSLDATTTFATSSQIVGKAYAADYTPPTPAKMTTAISDMELAYTDAHSRTSTDIITELGAGNISGLTLAPGLYKWGTGLLIATDVTLDGGANDVWIFQIAGDFTMEAGIRVNLAGGAQPKNIFWASYGAVALNPGAHLEGIIISQTEITLATGSTINGRLLSQTAVTLDASTVTQPAP